MGRGRGDEVVFCGVGTDVVVGLVSWEDGRGGTVAVAHQDLDLLQRRSFLRT